MQSMSVNLAPEQVDELQELSRMTGAPMSVIIRMGVDLAIKDYRDRFSLKKLKIEVG